jgi:hypothetical protein
MEPMIPVREVHSVPIFATNSVAMTLGWRSRDRAVSHPNAAPSNRPKTARAAPDSATAPRGRLPSMTRPMRTRLRPTTLRPTSSHMRRIWRFLPSVSTKRSCSGFCQLTWAGLSGWPSRLRPWRRRASMAGGNTACTLVVTGSFSWMVRSCAGRSSLPRSGSAWPGAQVAHAHQVFLLHRRVFADELARHAAVLRQHQQADRVDVEPAGRGQAAQLRGVEEEARVVVTPAVLRGDQRHGGIMTVLGLAADMPHRLVEQDGDLRGLLALACLSTSIRSLGPTCSPWARPAR